jgi:hypothetical protein
MTRKLEQSHMHTGDHLRKIVKFGSFGGLLFSLFGTGLVLAGTDSFNCSTVAWKVSLALNLVNFVLAWIAYIPFRNTDLLLGNGLITIFVLLNMFWTFGFGGFYFYFLFAPINIFPRTVALVSVTAIIFHRAYRMKCDIDDAFRENKNLINSMYCNEGTLITFKREAIDLLEKARRERPPFNPIYVYAALLVTPFVFVLNKLLTPVLGEGHGVFLALAFFAIPMMLWGVDLLMQTVMSMVCYPIKLQQKTGKPVVLKDW